MPKRVNPFGDCSPLQFKTHIGKKEIDMGVCHEQNMKEVYEKTKDLLFKGAQKQITYEVDVNSNRIEWQPNIESDPHDPLPGQMCFDKNCQLTMASSVNQSSAMDTNIPSVNVPCRFQFSDRLSSDPNSCCHCKKTLPQQCRIRCYFCDKSLCSSCSQHCDNCMEKFCQMCSVKNYDEVMERAFCFNCTP